MVRAFLICLVLTAFAANSILNRTAVDGGHADPGTFAVVRVVAGAVVLWLLVRAQGRKLNLAPRARAVGAVSLAVYMVAFSVGYLTVDAGLGTVILFGAVQITMFVVSAMTGTAPTARQILGAVIAFVGLVVVMEPGGAGSVDPAGACLLVAAGAAWGFYTLEGRRAPDALSATAANFVVAVPLVLIAPALAGVSLTLNGVGIVLAVVSGAVTSGLGYALWYRLLPGLQPTVAAILMLGVPVIAVAGGVALLSEPLGWSLALGGMLVLGGLALATLRD